jgi:hypothetical protein
MAEALKLNSTLTFLDLDNNNLGENSGIALAEALPGMCNGLVVALGLLVLTNSCTPLLVKSLETDEAQDLLLRRTSCGVCN